MSEHIEIRTLWITRKSIDSGFHVPELVEAWDDFSADENFEGWRNACEQSLESVGSDLAAHRYIRIRVPLESIAVAFEEARVEGRVSP